MLLFTLKCCVTELMVEFMISHLSKSLSVDLYRLVCSVSFITWDKIILIWDANNVPLENVCLEIEALFVGHYIQHRLLKSILTMYQYVSLLVLYLSTFCRVYCRSALFT